MPGRFIAGIAAIIVHDDKYLLLKRSSIRDFEAGQWDCVTGRLEQGEGFEEAVHREVMEEIGIEVSVDFLLGTSHFYRGEAIPENELVGVVYACSTTTPDAIRHSDEHSEYRWITATEAVEMLSTARPSSVWLRNVIERAELLRQHIPESLVEQFRREGFETE
jgi:8-oxo-dGTP diphosphatase